MNTTAGRLRRNWVLVLPLAIGLAAGSSGPTRAATLYVADFTAGAGSVKRFDGTTGALIDQLFVPGPDGLDFPGGLVLGPGGNLYVADNSNSVVYRFNGATGAFLGQFIGASGGLVFPTGMAFGADGRLYVANTGFGNFGFVNRYDATTGAFIDQFVPPNVGPPGGLSTPAGITFGPDGNLYVADPGNGVARFNRTSAAFDQFVPLGNPPSPLSVPAGLVFGPDGNLYVADVITSTIHRFNGTTGAYEGDFIGNSGGLVQPIGLVFGPDGNLYVTDGMGRVARFNGTTGAAMADFVASDGSTLINPQFLAFSSDVPEPSTLALISLGAVVLLARGRAIRNGRRCGSA